LDWVLSHKLVFSGIVLVLFAMTLGIMRQGIIGKELISTGDQGKFRFALEFDKSTAIQQNDLVAAAIEQHILDRPEVATLFSNVGGPSTGIGSLGVGVAYKSEFTVQLKDPKRRSATCAPKISCSACAMTSNSNTPTSVSPWPHWVWCPRTAPIEMTISGGSWAAVQTTGAALKDVVQRIPGADNVQLSVEEGSPEYTIVARQGQNAAAGFADRLRGAKYPHRLHRQRRCHAHRSRHRISCSDTTLRLRPSQR
jgi:HAE1 family hydrophobic/amphiphilic exporter-1